MKAPHLCGTKPKDTQIPRSNPLPKALHVACGSTASGPAQATHLKPI